MAKVQGYTARVSGHTLMQEGALYQYSQETRTGYAQCTCGSRERVASSGAAKRWHRQHKADVVLAQS